MATRKKKKVYALYRNGKRAGNREFKTKSFATQEKNWANSFYKKFNNTNKIMGIKKRVKLLTVKRKK
tara:strand:+ start:329 stop:529 length:201 start_codon:yes stop_codon:yes gene_type:complete